MDGVTSSTQPAANLGILGEEINRIGDNVELAVSWLGRQVCRLYEDVISPICSKLCALIISAYKFASPVIKEIGEAIIKFISSRKGLGLILGAMSFSCLVGIHKTDASNQAKILCTLGAMCALGAGIMISPYATRFMPRLFLPASL
ncbi:MAG: hypothetical protein HN411_01010 [Waddliaceae bacterium]|jgi:hypothetical protein|nr:hypothetical protein [Waddliaceae bacterium]MBT3579667.1 hypothetical protein [Waddliaceae bacterium]MBT4445252.1 hypothetical protein [Waddliaceae bacterium]MBT6928088.1 hypothetical protein [Waddliaceae bacterium]MBT7264649.1 hypothetical protein [Waddliaceae bacterium]